MQLSSSTITLLVHDSYFPLTPVDASHTGTRRRAALCKTREKRKRKKEKDQQLPLLGFLSSYETKSLFLMSDAERNLKVVAFTSELEQVE